MMPANRYGLSLSDPDGLERWREKVQADEQALRRERARERRVDTVAQLRTELLSEIASLRVEMMARHELQQEAVGQCLGEYAGEAESCLDKAIKRIESAFWTALERRFAELNARLDVLTGAKPRAQSVVQDLPNPLQSRRGLN
jgi:hypothetical protein